MKNVNVPKHDAAKTKSIACDFEWFSENFMQIDVSALVRSVCFLLLSILFFLLLAVVWMIQFHSLQIFDIEWFQFKWKNARNSTKHFAKNKEINKIFWCCWKSNIQYGKYTYFAKVIRSFFYCCIFICENGCRQSAANSLVSHKQRKHVLDIFLYFVVNRITEPGTVKHIAW